MRVTQTHKRPSRVNKGVKWQHPGTGLLKFHLHVVIKSHAEEQKGIHIMSEFCLVYH